ncbi:MAG: hypothetical protein GKS00_01425 [Alphaproteobacteria bacterium]|nr:hypothetical protein [Alphaproteobacteria bacterium]
MKKGLLIGGGVLIVVIAVGVYWFASNLDSLIKTAVETYGSEITKAEVTLDEVEISPTSGAGSLRGLVMGNPSGFKSDNAFSLGEVSVSIDTGSLGSDTIVIKEVVIGAPAVTYEIGANGSNIDAIRKNVESYVGGSGGGSSGGEKEGETKLIIENLYVRDGKVNVSATALGGKSLGAPLPTIHLKDIGKKSDGATPGEVADQVIKAVSNGATKAVGTLNLDKVLGGAAKDAMEKGKGVIEKGKDSVGGTLKNLLNK